MMKLPSQRLPKSGLRPLRPDHRDFDYLKTKKFGAVLPDFPTDYNVDAGFWAPDQNEGSNLFNPPVPPMPYGCTNFTQNDLCSDEDKVLYNPAYTESKTHANAHGGTDLRTSLASIVYDGVQDQKGVVFKKLHPAYFNIRASGIFDYFDAVRLAMYSTKDENRGVSVGTHWYEEFMSPFSDGILPIPSDFTSGSLHNWAIKGWKTINGRPYLIGKPWIGADYADKGFCYVSRELFNALMNIYGAGAFTIDKLLPNEVAQMVDLPFVTWLVSWIRVKLGL